MKKRVFFILIIILCIPNSSFASIEDVNVIIPEFDIRVNGELIDTEHSQYPVILHKNITYFPMTSDYLTGIGLGLQFSSSEGLKINIKDEVGVFEQKFLGANNILGSTHNAQLVPFQVEVNGELINNELEKYPVLLYKDITYFPMTWRFAVDEFGWTTKWSGESGFGIHVSGSSSSTGGEKRIFTTTEIGELGKSVVKIEMELLSGTKASGSGFFYNGNGGIVTSHHVIENAETIKIIKANGDIYSGNVVVKGYSADYDILILDTDITGNSYLTLGDSDTAKVGNKIYAIGSPYGLVNTLSEGIISAIRTEGMQISADTSPGSSGGALFNQYGEVIGVTNLGYGDGIKIDFATPINKVKALEKNKELSLIEFYIEESDLAGISDYEIMHYVNGGYIGEIENGTRHGLGAYHYDNGNIYIGDWHEGRAHGTGTEYYGNGDIYEGEWYEDKFSGWGVHRGAKGDIYRGYWLYGEPNGLGEMIWATGESYYGYWENGYMHGVGISTYPTGMVYMGNYEFAWEHGYGKMIFPDGEYRGNWINGLMDGYGILTLEDGTTKSGNWKENEYMGSAPPPDIGENDKVINSYILPVFSGIEHGNLYELSNGQIWRQTSSEKKSIDEILPSVEINFDGSNYKMKFDVIEDIITVERTF